MGCQVDPRRPDRLIGRLASGQHGLVSRRQLLTELGISKDAVDKRVRRGLLRPVHRGVYAVGHDALTLSARWLAAVLSQGPGAVLSHASAAALWGIRHTSSPTFEVTVAARGGRRVPDRIRLHRVGELPDRHVTSVEAVPVTTCARTLADLAPRLSAGDLERAVEQSERLGLFDLEEVRSAVAGRPGCRRLFAICAAADPVPPFTRSELERCFLLLCRDHGLPRPSVNAWVGGHEVDFLWSAAMLIVETDGYEFHGTPWAFQRDHTRDLRLKAAGYEVVRLTYRQVTEDAGATAAALRGKLLS